MAQSDQVDQIYAALAQAQGMMKNAVFNRINPHFKNRYADLAAVIDAIREALSKNGIAVFHTIENGNGLHLTTVLGHKSGQWISSNYPLPQGGRPQEFGSALTYAKRYSLTSMVCIAADEDDDAELATKTQPKRENPNVNRAEDFVEDMKYDEDGNPVYIVPRSNKQLEQLRGQGAKKEYEKLQAEVITINTVGEFNKWVNLQSTIDRVHTLPEVSQGIFHNLCVSKLKELTLEEASAADH